jgi:RimJ/RimL family protein N-acetyltransferase
MHGPVLETDRLIMRPWRTDDLQPFAALNADPEVMEHFPKRLTREETAAAVVRIHTSFEELGFGLWALEERDGASFIGFTGLSVPRFEATFTPCVEVGWRLARPFWGRGYATEAATAALDHGFERVRLKEIVSFTTTTNRRSQRVMQRLGMVHDQGQDFLHPNVAEGHHLRLHVLYRLTAQRWREQRAGLA